MRINLSFIPKKVRHLKDWADFVLAETYLAFVDTVESALDALEEEQQLQAQTLANHTHSAISNGGGSVSVGDDGNVALSPSSTLTLPPGKFVSFGGVASMGEYGGDFYTIAEGSKLIFRRYPLTDSALSSNGWGFGTIHPSAAAHVVNSNAAQPVQILQAAAGQTAPLQKTQLISSTGTVRDASSIDTIETSGTDANFTTEYVIKTRNNGNDLYERLRLGGRSEAKNYAVRVLHNEGEPNKENIAAYFEASGSSVNTALETGPGRVKFGGPVNFQGHSATGLGNIETRGARGTTGNLVVGDTTTYGGGTVVLAGDDRGQGEGGVHPFAWVRGFKENGTYLNRLGALSFGTQTDSFTGDAISDTTTIEDWMFLRSDGVLELKECAAPPTGLRFGDFALYVEGGALKARSAAGTITTIAAA